MTILGVFAGVLVMLVPVAIVALIIAAAVNKDKGNDASKFSMGVRAVYTYVIVIATLFMIIAGTITAVSSLLDYFLPESELEAVEDRDCDDYYSSGYCNEQAKQLAIKNEKNEGMTAFASSLALVLVATPLFVSYSKEAKKIRDIKIEAKEKEEAKKTTAKVKTTTKAKTETKKATKTK